MKQVLLILITMYILTGCKSNTVHDEKALEHYYKAVSAVNTRTPEKQDLVRISCPTSGCIFDELVVSNPAPTRPIHIDKFKTTAEASAEVAKVYAAPITTVVTSLVNGATLFGVAKVIGENAGSGNTQTHNTTLGDGNTSSTDMVETSHDGTIDSHAVDNSDNSTVDRHDTVDSHDQTATPTVVNPVVVNPEVVIVE